MTDVCLIARIDREGEAENCRGGFALMLEQARIWATRYPDNLLVAYNLDRCDCDTDGLTLDEGHQFDDTVHEARAERKAVAL